MGPPARSRLSDSLRDRYNPGHEGCWSGEWGAPMVVAEWGLAKSSDDRSGSSAESSSSRPSSVLMAVLNGAKWLDFWCPWVAQWLDRGTQWVKSGLWALFNTPGLEVFLEKLTGIFFPSLTHRNGRNILAELFHNNSKPEAWKILPQTVWQNVTSD